MKTYLTICEHNAILNDNIATKVKERTLTYSHYHMLEMFMVLIATIGQVYFIRRLLKSGSVI